MTGTPLKHLVDLNDRALGEDTDPERLIRYLDIGSVSTGVLVDEPKTMSFGEAPSRARRLVRQGDTIVSTVRTYLRAVWPVRQSADDLVVSTGFAVLTPRSDLDSRYLGWIAQSNLFVDAIVARSVGVSYPAVNPSEIGEIRVNLPPLSRQRAIADYLDTETVRVDALIAKKQELKTRLLERRVALTYAAATGDAPFSTAERTYCEVPWATSRPEHWRDARLTLVAQLGSGHTPSRERPEWWMDCNIPWITTGEVAKMRRDQIEFISETRESISDLGLANSSAELHPAGTVVLSRTASAGFSAIMGRAMATSQDFVVWTCGPLLEPRFLLLCLRAMRGDLLNRLAQGSTHKTIYMPDIKSISLPLPPVEEQQEIVKRAWLQLRRIDAVSERLDHQTALIHEHRQALITAAVAGELEIPGVAT